MNFITRFNLRPTEIQAGFGIRQIEKLPSFNKKKRADFIKNIFFPISTWLFHQKFEVFHESTPSWLGIPIVLSDSCPFSVNEFSSYLEKKVLRPGQF